MVVTEWILAVLLLAAAVLLAVDLVRSLGRSRRERAQLEHLANGRPDEPETPRPRPRGLRRQLLAAGLRVGWLSYVAVCALVAMIVFLLLPRGVGLWVAIVLAVLAGLAPWPLLTFVGRWRARRFEVGLADAVGYMVAALEAGQNPPQAFATAARSAEGVVATELLAVHRRLDVGMEMARALRPVVDGYDSPGVLLFAQTVIAKSQTGGDLAPVLRSVGRLLRERIRLRLRLRRQLAGARFSAIVVAVLPYVVIPLFLLIRPDWLLRLIQHPQGPPLLLSAFLLQVAGFLWLRRILRVDV